MAGKSRPQFTENFAANLDGIRIFLEPEGKASFQRLIGRLFDDIVPTLCRFPQSGRPFLAQPVRSVESQALLARLEGLLRKDDELREFVVDDYIILYLVRQNRLVFLAIKHHYQLSFDLKRLWL